MTPRDAQVAAAGSRRWSKPSTIAAQLLEGVYLLGTLLTFLALLGVLSGWGASGDAGVLTLCLAGVAWGGALGLVALGWSLPRSPRLAREVLLSLVLCVPLVPWCGAVGALAASGLGVSTWALDPEVAGFCTGAALAFALTFVVRLNRPLEDRW